MFYPFKCKICQQGFTMINNKEGSCHHHPKSIRYDLNTYNPLGAYTTLVFPLDAAVMAA